MDKHIRAAEIEFLIMCKVGIQRLHDTIIEGKEGFRDLENKKELLKNTE